MKLRPNHGLVLLNRVHYDALKKVLGDKLKNFDDAQTEYDQSGDDQSNAAAAPSAAAPATNEVKADADDADKDNGEAESATKPGKAGRPRRTE